MIKFQSAPRSRERDDFSSRNGRGLTLCFNPRPALASGTTDAEDAAGHSRVVSIRAPLSRAGRLLPPNTNADTMEVSIRAPLSRAGRRISVSTSARKSLFQSAPRSRERDDYRHQVFRELRPCFNPRPALASGTTQCECGQSRMIEVSIRAPLSRAGRLGQCSARPQRGCFNPRPALASGTTTHGRSWSVPVPCFNPRPALASGTTTQRTTASSSWRSFNPRPALASGTTQALMCATLVRSVSIRAPLSRAGRRSRAAPRQRRPKFQSAPRSRERDDNLSLDDGLKVCSFNPRPALASGTTRRPGRSARLICVSIRAPLSRAGRR